MSLHFSASFWTHLKCKAQKFKFKKRRFWRKKWYSWINRLFNSTNRVQGKNGSLTRGKISIQFKWDQLHKLSLCLFLWAFSLPFNHLFPPPFRSFRHKNIVRKDRQKYAPSLNKAVVLCYSEQMALTGSFQGSCSSLLRPGPSKEACWGYC